MIVYYTHWCLNCGDDGPNGVSGAPTTLWEEACARCGSLSVMPIAHDAAPDEDETMDELDEPVDAFQALLTLAEAHERVVREKDARIRELEGALGDRRSD